MPYAGIEPNSTIIFYKNVLSDSNYENTYYFDTILEQLNFFNSETHVLLTLQNNYYQRSERGVIKVGWTEANPEMYLVYGSPIKALYNVSYFSFRNTAYENKIFFAFVDKVTYINDNTVAIHYSIDVIQTWLFDFTDTANGSRYIPWQCLIEREHTSTDYGGEHTIPEGLETGPYVTLPAAYVEGERFTYTPAVVVFYAEHEEGGAAGGAVIDGMTANPMARMYTGLRFLKATLTNQTEIDALQDKLSELLNANKVDGIVSLTIAPEEFLPSSANYLIPKNTTVRMNYAMGKYGESYAPRNGKLLTYPYNFLYCTTNNGNTAEFRWELFNESVFNPNVLSTVHFSIWGNYSASPSLIMFPSDYDGVPYDNHDQAMILQGFPLCSFSYDTFKAWLAQNAGSIGTGLVSSGINLLRANLADIPARTRRGLGYKFYNQNEFRSPMAEYIKYSESEKALSLLGQIIDHASKPDHVTGSFDGNVIYQSGLFNYDFYYKTIQREYAIRIDDYFDMYGYKVNRMGYPVLANRPCYTFIKTVGCELKADIPVEAEQMIKSIFDSGIRFWKDKNEIGLYGSSRTVNNRPR